MPWKLTKQDLLELVPAVPATPYIPGYDKIIRTWPPGGANWSEINAVIGDWNGGSVLGRRLSDGTIVAYTRVPAVPASPGRPAYTIDHGVAGWNAGGNSMAPLDGDGAFRFNTNNTPGGVVVGLVTANYSTLPMEQSHAIYVAGNHAHVMEAGSLRYTFPSPVDGSTVYIIRRTGSEVRYSAGAEQYDSSAPITEAKVYLDASLYLSGDYVDNPELFEGSSGLNMGFMDVTLPRLGGYVSYLPPNYVEATLPMLQGEVYRAPFGSFGTVLASFPPLGGMVTILQGSTGDIDATLPMFSGIVADYPYSTVEGVLPALTGYVATISDEGLYTARSRLEMGAFFSGVVRASGSVGSKLRMGSTMKGVGLAKDAVYDGMLYMDEVHSHQKLFASINSTLALSSGLGPQARGDQSPYQVAARAPSQFAVNTRTGALTTYDGFEFSAFANANGKTYASRAGGVYRLRAGDDAGSSRIVAIDFGIVPLGANAARVIETVYLGLDTDGKVFVRMSSGDLSYVYPATRCRDLLRAVPGKGAKDRRWNLSIEVEDATYLNLDLVELYVTETRRRWAQG